MATDAAMKSTPTNQAAPFADLILVAGKRDTWHAMRSPVTRTEWNSSAFTLGILLVLIEFAKQSGEPTHTNSSLLSPIAPHLAQLNSSPPLPSSGLPVVVVNTHIQPAAAIDLLDRSLRCRSDPLF